MDHITEPYTHMSLLCNVKHDSTGIPYLSTKARGAQDIQIIIETSDTHKNNVCLTDTVF